MKHGRSLIQLFRGNKTGWWDVICAEYTIHTRKNFKPRRCLRDQRYKYILNLLPNRMPNRVREEHYHLPSDRYEFKNLAGEPEHQNARNLLRGELLKWRQQTANSLLNPAVLTALEQEH